MAAKKKTAAKGDGADRLVVRKAVNHGRELATQVIKARDARRRGLARARAASNGLLVAEGDSWFDYPFFNIVERLEDKFDFTVESAAHNGDTIESMAYDASQAIKVARMFEKLAGQGSQPRAILLSGGGNDIAGDEFAMLLNHAASGLPVLNENIVAGVIDQRVKFAMVSVISALTTLSRRHFGRTIPIVIHGYGHAVPDGRGYLGGGWILPGPWLKPGFIQKGYGTLRDNVGVLVALIDRFNAMLQTIPGGTDLSHVSYLDLRPTLTNDSARYKSSWGDELHPTKPGFELVAKQYADLILSFPPGGRGRGRGAQPKAGRRRTRGRSK